MMDFLIKHKLINPSQHGFLKARSCLTNVLCFFEEITKWVDEGSPVYVIYLDFQKAFDKVPHQRLILKLKSHGMGHSIINWIEQWLKDRRLVRKWHMLFNFGKCKCLHTGSGNTGVNYKMGGTILSKTVKEKDLGVTMNANMKLS